MGGVSSGEIERIMSELSSRDSRNLFCEQRGIARFVASRFLIGESIRDGLSNMSQVIHGKKKSHQDWVLLECGGNNVF